MDDEVLSVEEAAAAYDVSALTLRRRAQYGEIDGAVKVRGRRGQEWRVPRTALESLGYVPKEQPAPDVATLLAAVRKLSESVAAVQEENSRLNAELGGAVAEAARLRSEAAAVRMLRELKPRAEVIDLRAARQGDEVHMPTGSAGRVSGHTAPASPSPEAASRLT